MLKDFREGRAPVEWTRESSTEGIAFVHQGRGIRIEAVPSDRGACQPDDPNQWTLVCRQLGREPPTRLTIERAVTYEEAVCRLYEWMVRINVAIRETGDDTRVDLGALVDRSIPRANDRHDPQIVGRRDRRTADSRDTRAVDRRKEKSVW